MKDLKQLQDLGYRLCIETITVPVPDNLDNLRFPAVFVKNNQLIMINSAEDLVKQ